MDAKTDRELIGLAAKAAGAEWQSYSDGTPSHWSIKHSDGVWRKWDPREDDGDAIRLAVDLGLFGTPALNHYLSVLSFIRGYGKYELMRRAIVMAAAKIGENMK